LGEEGHRVRFLNPSPGWGIWGGVFGIAHTLWARGEMLTHSITQTHRR
jgi:hypothetical protein